MSKKDNKKKWHTTEEIAEYLGVPRKTIWNKTSSGELPVYKLGRLNRYLLEDADALITRPDEWPYGSNNEGR